VFLLFSASAGQMSGDDDDAEREQQDGEDGDFERKLQERSRQLQPAHQEEQDAEHSRKAACGQPFPCACPVQADQDQADAGGADSLRQGFE